MSEKNKVVDQNFQNFNNNLRTTATGVRFARTLYTNPNSFTPKQITLIMRQLGLNIPKEVELTATLAQMYTAGSSIMAGYDTVKTLDDAAQAKKYQQLNVSSAQLARLGANLAHDQGWIDSDAASMINVGASVVMIIASAGMDASSWISLGLELSAVANATKMAAAGEAMKSNSLQYRRLISNQSYYLQQAAAELSEGKIGLFGFLSKTVFESSALFEKAILNNPNMKPVHDLLPNLMFLPRVQDLIRSEGRSTSWYGKTSSVTENFWFDVVGGYATQQQAMTELFKIVFLPTIKPYYDLELRLKQNNKASFFDYSKLLLLQNENYDAASGRNALAIMQSKMISPNDMGIDTVQNILPSGDKGNAISGIFNLKAREPKLEVAKLADQYGYTKIMLKNSDVRESMNKYFNYNGLGMNDFFLDISNFVAMLNMVEMIESDPFYQKISGLHDLQIDKYFLFESVYKWQEEADELIQTSLIRNVNQLARMNVASYLGIDESKLVRINDYGVDEAGIYRIKK